jgi:putative nucleotidyltransferase with HDIG domain
MTALESSIRYQAPPEARTLSALDRLVTRLKTDLPEAHDHASAVETLAVEVAQLLGFPERLLGALQLGAFLHDLGKLKIPQTILRKPGPLNAREWAVMRRHPTLGVRLLSPIIESEETLAIVQLHHERWDGTGYPHRRVGAQVPIAARIVAATDAFQAMIEPRPYRPRLSHEEALVELQAGGGAQFDPTCVAATCEVLSTSGVSRDE